MTAPPQSDRNSEILAAELMVQAHAAHLTVLHTAAIAEQLRRALPTAAILVVDTSSWYYAEEHGGGCVQLCAVLDDRRTVLWAGERDADPDIVDHPGGWKSMREDIHFGLFASLRYATPASNGWAELRRTELDLSDLVGLPDTDVHVVTLPPGQPATSSAPAISETA